MATYSLAAGIGLSVEGDAELARLVALAIPRSFEGDTAREENPIWRLRLERESEPRLPVQKVRWISTAHGAGIRTDAGRVILEGRDVCRILVSDQAGLGVLLYLAIGAILRRHRMLQLHAAALSPSIDAAALLVVGPSGAGKTTVAMNLARRGWRFLSDDSVVLSDAGGEFQAKALRHDFRVGDEDRAAKQFIDPDQMFPGQRVSSARVGSLVFVEQSGAERSIVTPMSREDAFARLPGAGPEFGAGEEGRWQLGFMVRLSGLPSFTLAAGRDVLLDDDSLARLANFRYRPSRDPASQV